MGPLAGRDSLVAPGATGTSGWADAPCAQVTSLVSQALEVPVALLSLPRAEEYRFRVNIGLDGYEGVPQRISFCAYTQLGTDLLVVEDARVDPRFHQNPLVVGPPRIIAYVGAPLISSRGVKLGTLCAIDHQPRSFESAKLEQVRGIARIAAWLLESEAQLQETLSSERERVAVMLHEGVAQDLFALRMQVQQVRNSSAWNPEGNAAAVAAGRALIHALDRSINDVCDIANGLSPGVADRSR